MTSGSSSCCRPTSRWMPSSPTCSPPDDPTRPDHEGSDSHVWLVQRNGSLDHPAVGARPPPGLPAGDPAGDPPGRHVPPEGVAPGGSPVTGPDPRRLWLLGYPAP